MNPNARSIDTPLLIQLSTGGGEIDLERNDECYGGALVCAARGYTGFFHNETTDFDGEAANMAFLQLCAAWDRATHVGIADGIRLPDLTENDLISELRGGHLSVSGDRSRVTDACAHTHPATISCPGPNDLELFQVFLRRLDRCATVEQGWACDDFCMAQYPQLLAIFRKNPVCRACAEDLAQRVWCLVSQQLPWFPFDPARGALASWIAAIARRLARDYARRHAERRNEPLTSDMSEALLKPDAASAQPGQNERLDETLAMIERFRASLPKLHQQILGKRWLEGMSFEDIASDLDESVDRFRGIVRRASPEFLILLRQVGLGPFKKKI